MLEAGNYLDYQQMNDVYGVTSDLKVYYSNSKGSELIGVKSEELDKDNPLRTVFSNTGSNSNMYNIVGSFDKDNDGTINAEELKRVGTITINAESNVSSLSDLYNFTSLSELILDGVSLNSLSGIENTKITYLSFKNYEDGNQKLIGDFSQISKLTKLEYLYLINSNNKQVKDCFTAMKSTEYKSLKYLGIYNSAENVSDISILKDQKQSTKEAVRYLYLYKNKISDITSLLGFKNIIELNLRGNTNISTLVGACDNMNSIVNLYVSENNLGYFEVDTLNEETDALSVLKGKNTLRYLELQNNQFKHITYIQGIPLSGLHISGNPNIIGNEIRAIRDLYNSIASTNRSIDNKYLPYLDSDSSINYSIYSDLTDSSDKIEYLRNNTDVTRLNLSYNSQLTNNKLNEILSTMTNMEYLSLRGLNKLTSIAFVASMPNLQELNLYNTNVTDISILNNNCIHLKSLTLNTQINLSEMATCLNRMVENIKSDGFNRSLSWNPTNNYGFVFCNQYLYTTLAQCSTLKYYYSFMWNYESNFTCDLSNTKVERFEVYYNSCNWVLPSSLTYIWLGYPINGFSADLSRCLKIKNIGCEDFATGSKAAFDRSVKSFSTLPNLESLNLKNMYSTFDLSEFGKNSFPNLKSLQIVQSAGRNYLNDLTGLSNLKNTLTYLYISYMPENATGFSEIGQLTKLQSLYLMNTSLDTLDFCRNLSNLVTLNANANHITDISGLIGNKSLTYISLTNNWLYDTITYKVGEDDVTVRTLQILADLNPVSGNGGQLKALYVSNQKNITTYDIVSSLSWPNGCSF